MKPFRLIIILLIIVLSTIKSKAQTEEVFYTPTLPKVEFSEAKTGLAIALKHGYYPNNEKNYWYQPENVTLYDDRFELTFKSPMYPVIFYFNDLSKYKLEVIRIHRLDKKWEFELRLGKLVISVNSDKDKGWELADYLYYFQQKPNVLPYDSLLVIFKPFATQYRELKTKPFVTEEQRKYIVQANVLNQQKMFDKAIELYKKALEVNPTAYPAAYTNLALLSAQIHEFHAAIYYMKKYLMLEPDATDARACQDKIYEWEILM